MNAQEAPPALRENVEIAARLRRLDDAEAVAAAGHLEIPVIVAGDLEEDAGIRPALVGLAGGVEKARAEAEAGGDALGVANRAAHCLQRRLMRVAALDIGEKRAIIAFPQ